MPNLLIVVFLQSMLYYGIILTLFNAIGIVSVFESILFPVFVLVTVLIAAGGNVINDIFDVDIDRINKPQKWIVGNSIEKKDALFYYFTIVIIGFLLAVWIAVSIDKLSFVLIYLIAVLFLFIYSRYLKRTFVLGNMFVSLFSAGVVGIILIFEQDGLNILKEVDFVRYNWLLTVFYAFMLFSFLSSLYRELVKDIEDADGDLQVKAKTIPIVIGIEWAKFIAGVISIVILLLLIYWLKIDINVGKLYMTLYTLIILIPMLFYSVWLLKNARGKGDFHKLSNVIKGFMLAGIFLLLFYINT